MMHLLYLVLVCLQMRNALLQKEEKEIVDFVNCTPEDRICERFECAPLLNCDTTVGDVIIQKGSLCGCCPICQTRLKEGDPCPVKIPHMEPISYCPLHAPCDRETKVCFDPTKGDFELTTDEKEELALEMKKMGSCYQVHQHREKALEKEKETKELNTVPTYDPFRLRTNKPGDLWFPECDPKGKFLPKQCKHKKCMCVDERSGKRIFGQEEFELAANMTCACSVKMNERKRSDENAWQTYEQEHCTTSGDYEPLQCVGDICFCADSATGKVLGSMVMKQQRELLPCYEAKKHKESYLNPCEKEAISNRRMLYDFAMKGISIKGLQGITCDMDGNFFYQHCSPDTCYCTDRSGISFGVYKLDRNSGALQSTMNCRCARDEEDNMRNHARYESLKCDQLGNFAKFQCFENQCFCVDEDGDRITGLMREELLNKKDMNLLCTHAINALTLPDEKAPTHSMPYGVSNDTFLRVKLENYTNVIQVGNYQ